MKDLDTIDFSLLSLSLCEHFIICVLILDKPVVCTSGVQSADLYLVVSMFLKAHWEKLGGNF